MKNDGELKITAQGDRELVMTRSFNASPKLVFDAYTKPELIKRWLGARNGWSFAVCEVDLRVGGKYRWVWEKTDKSMSMGMGGVYREIERAHKLVCTEKFDDPWYPGEAMVTVTFIENSGRTTLSQTMLYESKAARDAVLESPMEEGVAESYNQLEELLTSGELR
jgi:uncharacterized protein YndB with AHSA1/START domain